MIVLVCTAMGLLILANPTNTMNFRVKFRVRSRAASQSDPSAVLKMGTNHHGACHSPGSAFCRKVFFFIDGVA